MPSDFLLYIILTNYNSGLFKYSVFIVTSSRFILRRSLLCQNKIYRVLDTLENRRKILFNMFKINRSKDLHHFFEMAVFLFVK